VHRWAFPVEQTNLISIYKRIQDRSEITQELVALMHRIIKSKQDMFELSFNHHSNYHNTTITINCRQLGRETFNQYCHDFSNTLDTHTSLKLKNIDTIRLEIEVLLPLNCTVNMLKEWREQRYPQTRPSQRKREQTVFYQEPLYTHKNIIRKKPETQTGTKKAPIKTRSVHHVTNRLTELSHTELKDYAELSSELPRILRLLDNNILPPGKCSGSGLVYISKNERHKGTLLRGEIKIKLKAIQISWRICLNRASQEEIKNTTYKYYDITQIYKKNKKHIDTIKKEKSSSHTRLSRY